MNGRAEPLPIKKWKEELVTLTAERYGFYDEYYRLDDDLKSVDALRRGAESQMLEQPQKEQPKRAYDMSL